MPTYHLNCISWKQSTYNCTHRTVREMHREVHHPISSVLLSAVTKAMLVMQVHLPQLCKILPSNIEQDPLQQWVGRFQLGGRTVTGQQYCTLARSEQGSPMGGKRTKCSYMGHKTYRGQRLPTDILFAQNLTCRTACDNVLSLTSMSLEKKIGQGIRTYKPLARPVISYE